MLVEPEASTALCLQEELYDGPPRGAVPNQYSADLCLAATISILAAVSGHMVEKLNLNVTNVPLSPTAIGILYILRLYTEDNEALILSLIMIVGVGRRGNVSGSLA